MWRYPLPDTENFHTHFFPRRLVTFSLGAAAELALEPPPANLMATTGKVTPRSPPNAIHRRRWRFVNTPGRHSGGDGSAFLKFAFQLWGTTSRCLFIAQLGVAWRSGSAPPPWRTHLFVALLTDTAGRGGRPPLITYLEEAVREEGVSVLRRGGPRSTLPPLAIVNF